MFQRFSTIFCASRHQLCSSYVITRWRPSLRKLTKRLACTCCLKWGNEWSPKSQWQTQHIGKSKRPSIFRNNSDVIYKPSTADSFIRFLLMQTDRSRNGLWDLLSTIVVNPQLETEHRGASRDTISPLIATEYTVFCLDSLRNSINLSPHHDDVIVQSLCLPSVPTCVVLRQTWFSRERIDSAFWQ